MLNTLKMAGLAAAMTIGGLTSFAAPASAQSGLEIIIGPDGARLRARDYCESNPSYDGCRDWRRRNGGDRRGGYGGNDGYGDDRDAFEGGSGMRRPGGYDMRTFRRADRFCSAGDALDKARRMGIRRAQIVGMNDRNIRVAGRSDGRTVMVRFGRRGNCPVL